MCNQHVKKYYNITAVIVNCSLIQLWNSHGGDEVQQPDVCLPASADLGLLVLSVHVVHVPLQLFGADPLSRHGQLCHVHLHGHLGAGHCQTGLAVGNTDTHTCKGKDIIMHNKRLRDIWSVLYVNTCTKLQVAHNLYLFVRSCIILIPLIAS